MVTGRRTLAGAGVVAGVATAVAGGAVARQLLRGGSGTGSGSGGPGGVGEAGQLGLPVWPPGTRHREVATSDGATLHVAERGRGRSVLLLHGIALSAGVWSEQLRRLPERGFRVVALDLRGHGSSGIGREGLALDRLTADIEEVVQQLRLTDVVVVGHSMGGMALLRLLATDPPLARGERWLQALALVATSAQPATGRGIPGARLALTLAKPALTGVATAARFLPTPTLPNHEVADPIAALTFAEHPAPAAVRLIRRVSAGVPARTTVELLAQLVRLDEARGLAALAVPTTVVVGAGDLITPPRHARALAERIAGAELVELEGCGHIVMLERPAELDEVIVALAARSARPGGAGSGGAGSRGRSGGGSGGRSGGSGGRPGGSAGAPRQGDGSAGEGRPRIQARPSGRARPGGSEPGRPRSLAVGEAG